MEHAVTIDGREAAPQNWHDYYSVGVNFTYLCESCNPDPPCNHGTLQNRSMPNECQQTPTEYLSCPLGYAFHPEQVTYHKAMANCHSKHEGILATITGAEHQARIVKGSSCFRLPKNCLTEANVPRNASYWIGLHSLQNATRFTWESGSNTGYSNFHSGQPDNYGNVSEATKSVSPRSSHPINTLFQKEHAIQVLGAHLLEGGVWNDHRVSWKFAYVCEFCSN